MKTSRLLFLATCFLILTACNKTPPQPPPHAPDPVSQLKALIEDLHHPILQTEEENLHYTDIKYDVRKSDSLVSPFTATVVGREHVLDDKTHETAFLTDFVLTLNYQDGKWVFARCTGSRLCIGSNLDSEIKGRKIDFDEDGGKTRITGGPDFGMAYTIVNLMHLDE